MEITAATLAHPFILRYDAFWRGTDYLKHTGIQGENTGRENKD